MVTPLTAKVRIINPMGLHARPAGRFVATVAAHNAHVRVQCGEDEVDGSSILSLLMLEAVCGKTLLLKATGDDAEAVLAALVTLVQAGFEEADSVDGRGARG